MGTLEQRLEKIGLGINKLQESKRAVEEENVRLKNEIDDLRRRLEEREEQNTSLEKDNLLAGIANSVEGGEVDKKQMKLRINELVREVDKCIALLNQ